jgi:predicted component of type VI protein secretion system
MTNFQLVMNTGPTPGKSFTLSKQELIIGRDTSADIVINVAEVSRRHARLRLESGGYILEDLGSTNGTFINGQRLTGPHYLRPGEIIQLGEAATLTYQAAQQDPNATVVSPASSSEARTASRPPVQPPPQAQPVQPRQQPPPAYSGQVPPGPAAPPMGVEESEGNPWLWASLGCVGLAICLIVVGAIAFDTMNLYCTPPFNAMFSFLYTCP